MKEEEVSRLRKQVRAFSRRLQRELPSVHGLSHTAQQMLGYVARAPDGLRPSQLAAEMQMTNSNVAAALRMLESSQLVVRLDDPSDGRKALIKATSQGVELVARIRGTHYAWLRRTIETLLPPKDQQLLLRAGEIMQRLAEHVPEPETYLEMVAQPERRPARRRSGSRSA